MHYPSNRSRTARAPTVKLSFPAFAVLSACALLLLLGSGMVAAPFAEVTLPHSAAPNPAVSLLFVIWILGLLRMVRREWQSIGLERQAVHWPSPTDRKNLLAVVLAGPLTFLVSVHLGLGPVAASALVGLAAAVVVKPHAVAAFAGSFVGMASPELFGLGGVTLASALAALVLVGSGTAFSGYGGKLGTSAWAGCLIAAALLGRPLFAAPVPDWGLGVWLLGYGAAAALITYLVSVQLRTGPVVASAAVGLVGAVLLPVLHGADAGSTLAVMVFCASFAGMSGVNRFSHAGWMIPAGLACGLAFMYSAPFLGGAGGKLGTIAFASVIGLHGLGELPITLLRVRRLARSLQQE